MTSAMRRPGRTSLLVDTYGSTAAVAPGDSGLTSETYCELITRRGLPSTFTVNSAACTSGTGTLRSSTTETSTSRTSTLDRNTGAWGACAATTTRQHAAKATERQRAARIEGSPR